ncbi:GIY-YIG nuclease family protein, partial [Listeria monocytogenes]|uniref:GIY-YIG nuclease family protein n=1 Tax=Listeria monocytogenes TaxID=1639 RepID=UPI003B56EEDB
MNIKLNENCSLEKPGIYFIKNTINNKMYIGSSTMKIYKRVQHHYSELKRDNHKNKHLQNAWNKYG